MTSTPGPAPVVQDPHPPATSRPVRHTAGALDIVGLVLAIVIPLAGLIVGLVACQRAHRLKERASGPTVAALIVAIVLLILQLTGAAIGATVINRSVQAARDAPECAAIATHSDLLTTSGPSAMYKILYLDAMSQGSVQAAHRYVVQTFNADIADFNRWHEEMPDLVNALPSGTDDDTWRITDAVKALDYLVDPSTGAWGDEATNEKAWNSIGLRVDTIKQWRSEHCS